MYLFSVNKKGTVLINPEAIKLCPELSVLDEKEVRFIILAYDYESPFNQQPETDRINMSLNRIYNMDAKPNLKSPKIISAIEAYKSLQYNPKREMIKVYEKKLVALSLDLEKDLSSLEIKKILDSQKLIRQSLRDLNNDLMEEEEHKATIKGGGQLSFIEKLMSNMEEYKRITVKKN